MLRTPTYAPFSLNYSLAKSDATFSTAWPGVGTTYRSSRGLILVTCLISTTAVKIQHKIPFFIFKIPKSINFKYSLNILTSISLRLIYLQNKIYLSSNFLYPFFKRLLFEHLLFTQQDLSLPIQIQNKTKQSQLNQNKVNSIKTCHDNNTCNDNNPFSLVDYIITTFNPIQYNLE